MDRVLIGLNRPHGQLNLAEKNFDEIEIKCNIHFALCKHPGKSCRSRHNKGC